MVLSDGVFAWGVLPRGFRLYGVLSRGGRVCPVGFFLGGFCPRIYAAHYLIEYPANIIQREKLVTGNMYHVRNIRNQITAILKHQARTTHRILSKLIKKYPMLQ